MTGVPQPGNTAEDKDPLPQVKRAGGLLSQPVLSLKSRIKLAIAGLVLTGMFALTGLLLVEVTNRLRDLATASTDNLQWNLAQLEVELLRLDREIASARRGEATTGQLNAVRTRFDIFYSRVGTYERGAFYQQLWQTSENQEVLQGLRGYLQQGAALVDAPEVQFRAGLEELAGLTEAQKQPVRTLLLTGVQIFAQNSDSARLELSQTLIRLMASTVLLIVVLVSLSLTLLRLLRSGRRVARESDEVRARLEAMVTSSLDAIVVADTLGRIVELNKAAEEVFGYSRSEALGAYMAELIVPEPLRDAHRAGMKRFVAGGEKRVIDAGRLRLEALRKSGEVFPVELSISAARMSGAQVFVSFLRDITQQVQAEVDLKQARDEARAGEKAKADLLTVMSHEMRTPLNGILGSLQLMQRDPLSDRQQRHVQAATVSGDLLLSHVNDVLDLSRLDANMSEAVLEEFDLGALIDTVLTGQLAPAKARQNRLHARFLNDGLDHVLGDRAALNRCLINLVGNAVKFTEGGEIAVEVERLQGDQVEIRVTDTGMGIPEDKLVSVFEEFVTVDPSYGRKSGGTGLGLSITQKLVAQMGGEILVDSIEGEGSMFQISLPLPVVAGPETVASVALETGAALPAKSILVVEDNAINREILTDMLEDLGQTVTCAPDGAAGVAAALATEYDLILMDISMPGMDGPQALAKMREGWEQGQGHRHGQGCPAIAVTAHASGEDHQRIIAAGFVGIVTKPVSLGQLHRALAVMAEERPAKGWVFETGLDQQGSKTRDDFVSRMGEDSYQKLRGSFSSEAAALLSEIEAEGLSEARQLNLHNLAGVAGLLGESALQQALKALEDVPPADWPQQTAALLDAAQQALARLSGEVVTHPSH